KPCCVARLADRSCPRTHPSGEVAQSAAWQDEEPTQLPARRRRRMRRPGGSGEGLGGGRSDMRRLLWMAVAGLGLANTGCLINPYSTDPVRRMNQLLVQSEDLRQIEYEVDRIMFVDQPSHLTPERIHGGVGQ